MNKKENAPSRAGTRTGRMNKTSTYIVNESEGNVNVSRMRKHL